MNTSLLLPSLLFFSVNVIATVPADTWQSSSAMMKKQVAAAITAFEQTPRKNWAFEVSRYENEEGDITSSKERYQPHKNIEENWSLLMLNGNKPTAQQKQDFAEEKMENSKSFGIKLSKMVAIGSLLFDSENTNIGVATFNVHIEKLGKKASKKLRGTLVYDKKAQFINEIVIENTESFSPIFSAEIDQFIMTLAFKKIDQAILPHQKDLVMKGSFAFFTEIDETSTDKYFNYQYLPLTAE